jgi:hypothetical protein
LRARRHRRTHIGFAAAAVRASIEPPFQPHPTMNRLPIRPALICLFTLCAMVSVGLFACSGPDNGAAPPPARTAH